MSARTFLGALYDAKPANSLIVVSYKRGRGWGESKFAANVKDVLPLVVGQTDAYCRITTVSERPDTGRGTEEITRSIPGLWFEVDINGAPDGKGGEITGAFDTVEDGIMLANDVLALSMVVQSGYGAHGYVLFDRPLIVETDEDRARAKALVQRYHAAVKARAIAELGIVKADSVFDLARVFRPPESLNGKGERPVPVELMFLNGRRITTTEADAALPALETKPKKKPAKDEGSLPFTTDTFAEEHLDADEVLARIARRQGPVPGDGSGHAWDHLLACTALRRRHDDTTVTGLIRTARALHGERKGERDDYIAQTLAAAHEAIETEDPEPTPASEPGDQTSVGRIRRALFEDSVATLTAGDIVRDAVPGINGLLHRGLAHSFFGDRGEGKTVTALTVTVAAAALNDTERVLVLDRENGAPLTRSLVTGILQAHQDWPDVLADGRWTGQHYPSFSRDWQPADYAEAIAGLGYTGVVYDSLREVISELGGDPNSDEDISAVQRILITPLLRRGLWVVVLDNVGHTEKGRPKGSGAKLDSVPIAYQVRTVKEFGPDKLGEIAVKCTRSRYGDTGLEWTAEIGEGVFDIPAIRDESGPERAARDGRSRFVAYAREVVDTLQREQPLGSKELDKRVKGARTETRRKWRDQMIAESVWELVHDEASGYSLRGGAPRGAPAPLKGGGHPGDPTASDSDTDSCAELELR